MSYKKINDQNIMIGVIDVAGQANLFAKGFRENGFIVTTFMRGRHINFQNETFDILIKRKLYNNTILKIIYSIYCYLKYCFLVPIVIAKNDIFLFQAGVTFFNGYDLPILAFLNKKIIILHNGSDIRWWPSFHQMMLLKYRRYSYCPSLNDIAPASLSRTLRTIRRSEKYSDLLISSQDANIFGIKSYLLGHAPINIKDCNFNVPNNNPIVIVHSPSFPLTKGTPIIRSAVDELKEYGYDIIYKEIVNKSHSEVLEQLSEADILIEQIGQIVCGKNALEGLASGCLVFSDIDKNIITQYHGIPVIPVNVSSIVDRLKKYLDDRSLWSKHLDAAIPYLKNNHKPKIITRKIMEALNSNLSDSSILTKPDYFIKYFYPFDNKSTILINKYTKILKKCNWYKYGSSYDRDGLKF